MENGVMLWFVGILSLRVHYRITTYVGILALYYTSRIKFCFWVVFGLEEEQCSGCSKNIVQRYLWGSLHSYGISTIFLGFPVLGSH